jgi:hypothetical protein
MLKEIMHLTKQRKHAEKQQRELAGWLRERRGPEARAARRQLQIFLRKNNFYYCSTTIA